MNADNGRLLGLDAGDRRIGLAVSDPARSFALPLRSVERDGRGGEVDAIEAVVRDQEIAELVVGLPLSLSGEAGPQAESARAFGRELEARLGLPVHLWDERLSTQEAQRLVTEGRDARDRGRRGRSHGPSADLDALAASIILQAYIDSLRAAAR